MIIFKKISIGLKKYNKLIFNNNHDFLIIVLHKNNQAITAIDF